MRPSPSRTLLRGARALAGGCAWLVAGCAAGTGARASTPVVVSEREPAESGFGAFDCRFLGYVAGRSGGTFAGLETEEQLVRDAIHAMTERAAALGATFVKRGEPRLVTKRTEHGPVTTTGATVQGTAYACTTRVPERPAPPAASARPPSAPAPGFHLGQTAADAERACSAGGAAWTTAGEDATCSSTDGASGTVTTTVLHLSAGVVSGMDVSVRRSPP